MYKIVRNDAEINEVLNKAAEALDIGSCYPGESYENGILALFDWLTVPECERPFEDE